MKRNLYKGGAYPDLYLGRMFSPNVSNGTAIKTKAKKAARNEYFHERKKTFDSSPGIKLESCKGFIF